MAKCAGTALQVSVSFLVIALLGDGVWASMPQSDYLKALQIADQHVRKQKAAQAMEAQGATALISDGHFNPLEYPYQAGQKWIVAAQRTESSIMRRTDDPSQLAKRAESIGFFQYEVVQVTRGEKPKLALKITPIAYDGIEPVDTRVNELSLTVDGQFRQVAKAYKVAGRAEPIAVNPDGIRSRLSPMELYPLDAPSIFGVSAEAVTAQPELPGKLAEIAKKQGFALDPGKSHRFDQDDFFGRGVEFIWQKGDPWPAYMKTPMGVAVLVRKGAE